MHALRMEEAVYFEKYCQEERVTRACCGHEGKPLLVITKKNQSKYLEGYLIRTPV